MLRSSPVPSRAFLAGFLIVTSMVLATGLAGPADAHGSTQQPASRAYTCRFEQPDNPMCAAAWAANSQALYDWMEVNIGDAAGRHRERIPDGQLCSAGRAKYAALDQPGAWPVTALRTDGSGLVDLVYENTAPHSTQYYRVYITRPGFDARTDELGWNDLELAYDSGPLTRSARQVLRAPLPDRDVPAILYIVWQRSDSPEAFYACSDVTVTNSTTGTTAPPPTTAPPTTRPTTTAPRSTRPPATVAPTTSASPTSAPTVRSSTVPPPTTAPSTTAPASTDSASSARPAATTPSSPTGPNQADTGSSAVAVAPEPTSQQPSTSLDAPAEDDLASSAIGVVAPTPGATTPADGTRPGGTTLDQEVAMPPSDQDPSTGLGWSLRSGVIGLGSLGLVLIGLGVRSPGFRRRAAGLLNELVDRTPDLGTPSSGPTPMTEHYDVRHVGPRP